MKEYTKQIQLRVMSEVFPENVKWLWRGRIPLAKLTIIQGDPGLGKSTIALDIAARVSRDNAMPDGTHSDLIAPANVLLMTAEDGLADTIRPRLDALGADSSRVFTPPNNVHWTIPSCASQILEAVKKEDAKLVIIDPLAAYLDMGINSWSNQHVRQALKQISTIAENTGVAFLIIDHLNKRSGVRAIQRGSGSMAFNAAVRSVLLVGKMPSVENQCVLASVKCNVAGKPKSLVYKAVMHQSEDIETVKLEWSGECDLSADDLVGDPSNNSIQGKLDEAMDWLRQRLSDGQGHISKVVQSEAAQQGITEKTYRRALTRLGIASRPLGMQGEWVISLPVKMVLAG